MIRLALQAPVSQSVTAELERQLRDLLGRKGLSSLGLVIEVVHDLQRSPSGKMMLVRDMRKVA